MWRDLRLATRSLARSLTFTVTATLALGVAMGANATIFALIDGLWFRPPAVAEPDRLVHIFATTEHTREDLWSWPEFEDVRQRTPGLAAVAAIGRRGSLLTSPDGSTELLLANVVSADFFEVLGVRPAIGRLFGESDRAGAATVVLGHTFWQRRFGGDPAVLGRTLPLGRQGAVSATVVGVLPASFREIDAAADRDLWLSPAAWEAIAGRDELVSRSYRWLHLIGVRRPGVAAGAVDADVRGLVGAFAREFPASEGARGARVVSDRAYRLESGGANALALAALVVLVVLITCVNVANLLLARAGERRHERAVQVALGASRWRLLRQAVAEALLLGVIGGAAGLVIALWLVRALPAVLTPPPGFRSFMVFAVDQRVLLFTVLATVVTTLLVAVAPGVLAARANVHALVKQGGRGAVRAGRAAGLGTGLVVAQVAISLVLLSSAAVLTRSFLETQRADLGFSRGPVLTAWTASGATSIDRIQDAAARLQALPGVHRVAIAVRAPLSLSGGGLAQPVHVPAAGAAPSERLPIVKYGLVGEGYFDVLGTRLVSGRGIDASDEATRAPVAVVSRAFVTRFLPDVDPIGQLLYPGSRTGEPHRIVGVAENVVINRIGEPAEPYFYLPFVRATPGEVTFLMGLAGEGVTGAEAVRETLRDVDARLDPRQLVSMREYVAYAASPYQATAALASALGAVGLLLTALGVYGVMANRTLRRTREIGIRVALGAARREVLRMVMREGGRVALIGLAIGLPASLLATHVLRSLLFGVGPWDGLSLAGATLMLALTLGLAVLVPALRATRVNPWDALRDR